MRPGQEDRHAFTVVRTKDNGPLIEHDTRFLARTSSPHANCHETPSPRLASLPARRCPEIACQLARHRERSSRQGRPRGERRGNQGMSRSALEGKELLEAKLRYGGPQVNRSIVSQTSQVQSSGQRATKLSFPPAPAGYVAGVGRGALGFTTRSDIGPAAAARPPIGDRGAPGTSSAAAGDKRKREEDEKNRAQSEQQFDDFLGNDTGLFAGARGEAYDADDKEADEVWEAIDDRMHEGQRVKKEEKMKKKLEQYRRENPKITEQFSDLKRALGGMSEADWEQIPEMSDRSVKRTPKGKVSFAPVPDTLLARAAQEKQSVSTIDAGIDRAPDISGSATTTTDLTAVGEGRGTVLSMKLDRLGDKVGGTSTSVDPKGYLTSLQSLSTPLEGLTPGTDIQDVKKARKLLQSVTQTNPTHAPGWIAAARLESDLGKGAKARSLIAKGCAACPQSEDIWLHAALLQVTPHDKKVCVARGLAHNPKSVKLWLEAARLEDSGGDAGGRGTSSGGNLAQRRVLRKALERLPNSVRLWRALVDLSTEDDARVLLKRAVECCPQHKELWLALAKLESFENARKVLNKARQTLPTEPLIWITAAKLEEAKHHHQQKGEKREGGEEDFNVFAEAGLVSKIIDRAIKSLRQHGAVVSREQWLSFAEDCERALPPALHVCAHMVRQTIGMGVDHEDSKQTWVADAEDCLERGSVHTARSVLAHALIVFPSKKGLWRRAVMLEKHHGTPAMLDHLLDRAVTYCPQSEMLWLMGAKERWLRGDVPGARVVLQRAFAANPESEEIVLAAFKLEYENKETERAKLLLRRARDLGGGARVWMKSALLERDCGKDEDEIDLLSQGLAIHGKMEESWKLHLMLAQAHGRRGDVARCREAHERAIRSLPTRHELRTSLARFEETLGSVGRARAILEQARVKIPKCAELWLAAVRTERRAGNAKEGDVLMAKALQECPESGMLWSDVITTAPRPQRKSKSVDALKRCNNDPHVVCAVAQLFMNDHKTDKARAWFNRAVTLDPDNGDLWAHYYRFEMSHQGDTHHRGGKQEVERRCVEADPKHGERWQKVRKDLNNAGDDVAMTLRKTALDIEDCPIPTPL